MTQPKDLPHSPDLDHRFRASEAFYLGDALITPSLNRIEIHATAHQIEPKVMKVLLLLCARPGHVVYRDQILQPVWGQTGDDYLLNRAISELRKIFGDSAQNPAYIETIRKTGYRVLPPIKPVASAALVSDNPAKAASRPPAPTVKQEPFLEDLPVQEPDKVQQSDARRQLGIRHWILGVTGVLGVCAVMVALLGKAPWFAKPMPFSIDHYQVYPVTHFAGREYDAALSPDGSRITYVAERPEEPAAVFVKMLQGEQALQLSQEDHVSSPQWMPDGQNIVYLSLTAPGLRFLRVSPMGGVAQTLYQDSETFGVRGLSISRDGQRLVYAKRSAPDAPHQLWLLSVANGESSQLTTSMPGSLGDVDPLFAPDGKSLVFIRGSDEVTKDIYRLDLASQAVTRLTFDNRKINGLAWSPDGAQLLFTSTRSGIYRLWSIDRAGGEPIPLSLGWEAVQRPSTALGVEALVFEDWKHTAKLMSLDLLSDAASQPEPLKMSQRWDSNPSISADGKTLVFASNRGGPFGIWQSDLGSDVAYEWANLDGAFIDNPTWSPDGRQIVFDASPDGRSQLYLLEKGASDPQPLPLGDFDNRTPSWSRDGQWIYFESNRSGSWQVYGWRVATGDIRPVAAPEGKYLQESVDGQWLLFASGAGEGIWRCRKTDCLEGESATLGGADSDVADLLIPGVQDQDAYNWAPARDGVYVIRRLEDSNAPAEVAFFRYADGSTQTISALTKDFLGWGMTLAPDESRLYFTEMTQPGADIRIARP